jgi:hypothetical protein
MGMGEFLYPQAGVGMGVGKILYGGYGCGWAIPNGFVPIAISNLAFKNVFLLHLQDSFDVPRGLNPK